MDFLVRILWSSAEVGGIPHLLKMPLVGLGDEQSQVNIFLFVLQVWKILAKKSRPKIMAKNH